VEKTVAQHRGELLTPDLAIFATMLRTARTAGHDIHRRPHQGSPRGTHPARHLAGGSCGGRGRCRAISRVLGLDRRSMRRFARADDVEDLESKHDRAAARDPFK
jgi:hypothetical protein